MVFESKAAFAVVVFTTVLVLFSIFGGIGDLHRRNGMRALRLSGASEGDAGRRLDMPTQNFEWKSYLKYNPDIQGKVMNTESAAMSHYIAYGQREGRRYNKVMPGMDGYDWRAYLEMSPDLVAAGVNTEILAYNHYKLSGKREGRHSAAITSTEDSYSHGLAKLIRFIGSKKESGTPLQRMNLVIYHLEDIERGSNSMAVTYNNVKIFFSSILSTDEIEADQHAFYWINVASCSDNPLARLFSMDRDNVALVHWVVDGGSALTHLQTMDRLSTVIPSFSAVFFSSSCVRGPFTQRQSGQWMRPYRELLDENRVGIVGATLSCVVQPHIQMHFFVLRSAVVPAVVSHYRDFLNTDVMQPAADYLELHVTSIVRLEYKVSSMLHHHRLSQAQFTGSCKNATFARPHPRKRQPHTDWCMVAPRETNFVRWGGESLRSKGYLCTKALATSEQAVRLMGDELRLLSEEEPLLRISVDEATTGGVLYDLYQAYSLEVSRTRSNVTKTRGRRRHQRAGERAIEDREGVNTYISDREEEGDSVVGVQGVLDALGGGGEELTSEAESEGGLETSVCFLVRTAKVHDKSHTPGALSFVQNGIAANMESLLRQSNTHWLAFYYPVEKGTTFTNHIESLVSGLKDPRLIYLHVDANHRQTLLHEDTYFEASNAALAQVLARPECRWVSVTSANNAYGTAVVEQVLRTRIAGGDSGRRSMGGQSGERGGPDLLLAPLDSRFFAKQDYINRMELRWDQRCNGVEGMLHHNMLAYTAQPLPYPGKVDLAAVFFSAHAMRQENIRLGTPLPPTNSTSTTSTTTSSTSISTISTPPKYHPLPPCTDSENCAEGYFIRHLVRVKQWSYERLELSSLKSVIFHGNSPTLCVAAGNVWFDYPMVNNVGCISHKTLHLLQQKDTKSTFDWTHFFRSDMVCLRLSRVGFASQESLQRKALMLAKSKKIEQAFPEGIARNGHKKSSPHGKGRGKEGEGHSLRRFLFALNDSRELEEVEEVEQLHPPQQRRLAEGVGMPDDFDWREYLRVNPDLQAQGIVSKQGAVDHYLSVGRERGRVYSTPLSVPDFDWHSYLELNQDIAGTIDTEAQALQHYSTLGAEHGRPHRPLTPERSSYLAAVSNLTLFTAQMRLDRVSLSKRTLVIYHVESPEARENSVEVEVNNLRIFASSILLHPVDSPTRTFYLFNVMGDENPHQVEIPIQGNVGTIRWDMDSSDLYVHLRLLELLGGDVLKKFSAVFFSSTGVRGPLVGRNDGEWIGSFRSLLDSNNVGIVGPTVSCDTTPHVQTHMFGLRTSLVPAVLEEMHGGVGGDGGMFGGRVKRWRSVLDRFEVGMSQLVLRRGFKMASLLTHTRLKQPFFSGHCQNDSGVSFPQASTWTGETWCVLEAQEVVFLRWGGEANDGANDGKQGRYLCGKAVDMGEKARARVYDVLMDITAASQGQTHMLEMPLLPYSETLIQAPALALIYPETTTGGELYDLVRQYDAEMWLDSAAHRAAAGVGAGARGGGVGSNLQIVGGDVMDSEDSKVCFLIRTSIGQDSARALRSQFREMDLSSLIASLLRQVNPNWDAYFFITDSVPFENRLRRILREYGDGRLKYMSLDPRYRPAFTRVDAGYTPTDYVLNLLKDRSECRWLSITNADNVYGSETVQKVLDMTLSSRTLPPDMLLVPLDSRNFAEHDYNKRHEGEVSDRCKGISAMLKFNLLTYTKQPLPALGKVDLAAVFFQRRRFKSENILFGNFTDPYKYPCVGCQDGYLTQYLVRNRGWTYERMPLDGLKSIVFHGPSPTWCIAGGNVWFDYPHVNKVGCFSPETVAQLRRQDSPQPMYDWEDFEKIGRVCLRLSKHGFMNNAGKRD